MNRKSPTEAEGERAREVEFLERVRARCPRNVGVLKALGDLYTRVGRVEDGLEVDRRLVRLCPEDDMAWYNLGCSYALSGHGDRAFHALGQAVDLGYRDVRWMREDEDLDSLRMDPRFARLVERAASGR